MKVAIVSLVFMVTAFFLGCNSGGVERTGTVLFPDIDGNAVLTHTTILSSDEFEGRAPGTHGEEKTVNYIAEAFKKVGLEPGNTDGTFTQAVPLIGITANSDMTLTFRKGQQQRSLKLKNDFVAWTKRVADSSELKGADVVFVGYGIKAPEYDWDDYKGVDVKGKTLIMLVGDPPISDPTDPTQLDPNTFGGKAMTYYGRWTYQYGLAECPRENIGRCDRGTRQFRPGRYCHPGRGGAGSDHQA
jgi:hypothetical protein